MLWAGIVLYNPNIDRLLLNIERIIPEVDGLVLFNNRIDDLTKKKIEQCDDKIVCIGDGDNKGIAYALNGIMDFAKSNGAEWVITFDQDSVAPIDFVSQVKRRINKKIQKLGIICPLIVDKRRIYPANKYVSDLNEDCFIDMCITSGSCTFVKAWEDAGKFDDYLFIDLVDNDFCKRLRAKEWAILRMGGVELDQEFGNIIPRSEKTVNIFRKICKAIPNQRIAVNVSKLAYKKQVNPMRVYYTNRNIIYLNRKLRSIGGIGYGSYNARTYLGFLLFFDLPSILRSDNKGETLKSIVKGIKDGKKIEREV